jgi:hypothetical protein
MSAVGFVALLVGIFVALPTALVAGWARTPEVRAQWPEGEVVREARSVAGAGPFREGEVRERRSMRVKAGVPIALIALAGPAFMHSLMWGIAALLSLKELVQGFFAGELRWRLAAALALASVRATAGGLATLSALSRESRASLALGALALALDALLYSVAMPLSDSREGDRTMALAGLALFALQCAAVAWAAARRRSMIVRVAPALALSEPMSSEMNSERERVEVERS